MTTPPPRDHLPLSVPVYQVLLSLSDRELHGYAVIMDIAERTVGEVKLTASTLYGAVKRMLGGGMIRELDERPAPELDDSRRRYYAITPLGRDVLHQEAERLGRALRHAMAKDILTDADLSKERTG